MNIPRNVMYFGATDDLPPLRELRAGPLSLGLEGGDLRYIRLGEHELLRRVYVAVRDRHWQTIAPRYSNWDMQVEPSAFRVEFDADHVRDEINFHWHGKIDGTIEGTIRYSMEGEVRNAFWRNRIGFCVLHPMELAGAPTHIEYPDGSAGTSAFPTQIVPQHMVDGQLRPVLPFEDMRAVAHQVREGLWSKVEFSGDLFELEDQRNWTDASFKIYSTPIRLPFPVEVKAGEKIAQTIELSWQGTPPKAVAPMQNIELTLDPTRTFPLPRIGLGNAAHGGPLTELQAARLRKLELAHLRVDLDLSSQELAARLTQAWQDAQAIGAVLEAALFVSHEDARELQAFQTLLTRVKPRVARWLVFPAREHTPAAGWLELVRPFLAAYDETILLYGGTNGYFTELNRARPPLSVLDGVTYSVNPQVHAFDLRSVSECPPAIGVTVSSARAFCADKPLAISPITLRPRFNPHIVGPQPAPPPGELPSAVDPRQMSLFGAGWTLGALKAVTEAGLDSVTFYETRGWRGVMETDMDSPVPEKFFSRANMVFPLYHVFADVAELAECVALGTVSTHPLQIQALALRAGAQTRLLLCNLTNENQTARIPALSAKEVALQRLNEFTFENATMQPEEFRARPPERVAVSNGEIALTLLPFEIVRVDWINDK